MDKLEQLLLGRKIDWTELEYDLEDGNTFIVHRFSGTIIYIGEKDVLTELEDGTRKPIRLFELSNHLDQEPDFLAIRYAISRHAGALKRAAKLANHTPHDIYKLVDPLDKLIRYIGVSKQVELRYEQHLYCNEPNKRKNAWIRYLQAQELQPELGIIEHIEGGYYARKREKHWINHYLEMGMPLTNVDVPGLDPWYMEGVM